MLLTLLFFDTSMNGKQIQAFFDDTIKVTNSLKTRGYGAGIPFPKRKGKPIGQKREREQGEEEARNEKLLRKICEDS